MSKKTISIAVVVILAALFLYAQSGQDKGFTSVTPQEVKTKIANKEDIVLLDVRTVQEYNGPMGNIEGSILIPVQELGSRVKELAKFKDKEIIVYCRSGNRSRVGTQILMENGFNAINMLGGMRAWNKLPK